MHDTLKYLEREPIHRKWHHDELTFRAIYANSENYVLPLSHDEVVHGKGALLAKMPGDPWQKLRDAAPAVRLPVDAARQEAAVHGRRDRRVERVEPRHAARLGGRPASGARGHRALGRRSQRARIARTPRCTSATAIRSAFAGSSATIATAACSRICALAATRIRRSCVVANFTPVPREGYRIGVPRARVLARDPQLRRDPSTAAAASATAAACTPTACGCRGFEQSLVVTAPPLGIVVFVANRASEQQQVGLHPRPLLSAAAREPVARGDRAAAERASVSRLERADHRRVLSAEHRRRASSMATNQIIRIVDNYQRMSFNVGPTLMSWLERHAPDVHAALVDGRSREPLAVRRARLGDGAGLQPHDHAARVAARSRDAGALGHRRFPQRFGRAPEGMWLPECAVDTRLARGARRRGHRVHRARAASGEGVAAAGRRVAHDRRSIRDARIAVTLPSGRSIDLFFYDGATAQAVAFERLLADGHQIIARMTARGDVEGGGPTLCHIATDGETYGHHHRYGDMALAWALSQVESGWQGTRLTNYGEFRAKVPATWEVQLAENTSWSCAHGVARWRDDCGCNSGGQPGWNQRGGGRCATRSTGCAISRGGARRRRRRCCSAIRGRRATRTSTCCSTGATARDRVPRDARGARARAPSERVRALSLMEMARHAMLMYTSCGWFFDDLSGIETVQCMQYAARVAELIAEVGGDRRRARARRSARRARARTSRTKATAARVWAQRVRRRGSIRRRSCAHVAVHTLVEPDPARAASTVHGLHGRARRSRRAPLGARADGRGDACACARS